LFLALFQSPLQAVARLRFSHSFFCGRAAQDPLSRSDPRGQASGQISQRSSRGLRFQFSFFSAKAAYAVAFSGSTAVQGLDFPDSRLIFSKFLIM
jgi:hypothetical protein